VLAFRNTPDRPINGIVSYFCTHDVHKYDTVRISPL